MIKSEFSVLFNDRTLSVQSENLLFSTVSELIKQVRETKTGTRLQSASERIHQNSKEQQSTTTKETVGIVGQVVENRT